MVASRGRIWKLIDKQNASHCPSVYLGYLGRVLHKIGLTVKTDGSTFHQFYKKIPTRMDKGEILKDNSNNNKDNSFFSNFISCDTYIKIQLQTSLNRQFTIDYKNKREAQRRKENS